MYMPDEFGKKYPGRRITVTLPEVRIAQLSEIAGWSRVTKSDAAELAIYTAHKVLSNGTPSDMDELMKESLLYYPYTPPPLTLERHAEDCRLSDDARRRGIEIPPYTVRCFIEERSRRRSS